MELFNRLDRHSLDRRSLLVGAAAALPIFAAWQADAGTSATGIAGDASSPLTMWYGRAAGNWTSAMPIGNGRIGGMVFGRVAQERIQLNEDTLWAGSPYDPVSPEALSALPRVRALIEQKKFVEADALIVEKMLARPRNEMPYGAAGDLLIDFTDAVAPKKYRRFLDLDSAICHTQYDGPGGRFTRECFVSAVDQVMVVRLTADDRKGRLNFDLGYRHPMEVAYEKPVYKAGESAITYRSPEEPWDQRESLHASDRPDTLKIAPDGKQALLVQGRNKAGKGVPAGLDYALRIEAIGDGVIRSADDRIEVRNARAVTLFISVATSYKSYADVSGNAVARVRADTRAAASDKYVRIRDRHIADHRRLFRRFSIVLGTHKDGHIATDERIQAEAKNPDPAIAALYVQFARYLMISSSRPGTQVANLQGLWNEGTNPPWGSNYTININTQMNYWPVDTVNLGECVEPLVRFVEDLAATGARTAREMYGAGGWVAHHNSDLWRNTAPVDGGNSGMWPMGGAWLCQNLWDHYDHSRDQKFLERIYPLLRGASQFFLDSLVEDAAGRGLVTSPSLSPENKFSKTEWICAGPAMDRQILRDLFDRTIKAHMLTGHPADNFTAAVAAARRRLPPDHIGAQGQLQEWLDDIDANAPDQRHRHVSHLYAVYPSDQINIRDTPALIDAAKVTLNTRGDKATGWGTAWRIALWARMGDAERAHSILIGLLGPERTYPNMFDSHPPFQIDGNFGGAAAILEMLVQSWGGEVRLLPALPKAWPSGMIRGALLRGGMNIDMAWENGTVRSCLIRGEAGSLVNLHLNNRMERIHLDHNGRFSMA